MTRPANGSLSFLRREVDAGLSAAADAHLSFTAANRERKRLEAIVVHDRLLRTGLQLHLTATDENELDAALYELATAIATIPASSAQG